MREKIRNILLECGINKEDIESEDYIKKGFLDSLMMAEIIITLEDIFNIEINGNDIIPENFKNINTIIIMVERNIEKK